MRLSVVLAASLLMANPSLAREISGELAYSMRIALPPDATIAVQIEGPRGVSATTHQPARGAQVPLPFALADETGSDLTLRAAIFLDGRPLWTSQDVALPAGTDDLDLGTLRLSPHIALGYSTRLICGDDLVEARFDGTTARLRAKGTEFILQEATASSGRRFSDGETPETAYRSQTDRITVTLLGRTLSDCEPQVPQNLLPLRASGTEPFWSLTLAQDGLRFETPDLPPVTVPLPPAEPQGDAVNFTGEAITVSLQDSICRNAMSGMPFPVTVTVTRDDRKLEGCGGDPATLLQGSWDVVEIDGKAPRAASTVSFTVSGKAIAGRACNRFSGSLSLTGEGIALGPFAATRMACPDPQMQTETAAFAAFGATVAFDIDAEGALLLLSPEGQTLMKARH